MDQAERIAVHRAAVPAVQRYPLTFTGTGGEYFGIWIVNLLLTIATLGIYSAWAKVRRLQYFYRHTRLDGSGFDYHGRPLSILKGRAIALALIVFYNLGFNLSPVVGVVAAVLFGGALPWLIVQSMKFKLFNSSYRGLRFRFAGPVREAYAVIGIPLAFILAAGVFASLSIEADEAPDPWLLAPLGAVYLVLLALLPYLHWRIKRFQHNGARYGQARGRFHARARSFYAIYGLALLIALLAAGAIGLAGVALGLGIGAGARHSKEVFALLVLAGVLAFYGVLLGVGPFVIARLQNAIWNRSLLGLIGFDSAVKARRYVWIAVSNLLLILLTLGLYTPFAAVRLYRYRVQCVALLSTTDLAGFAAWQVENVDAVGEGAADLLDIDFAL